MQLIANSSRHRIIRSVGRLLTDAVRHVGASILGSGCPCSVGRTLHLKRLQLLGYRVRLLVVSVARLLDHVADRTGVGDPALVLVPIFRISRLQLKIIGGASNGAFFEFWNLLLRTEDSCKATYKVLSIMKQI